MDSNSPLVVDITFIFDDFYVVTISYSHLLVKSLKWSVSSDYGSYDSNPQVTADVSVPGNLNFSGMYHLPTLHKYWKPCDLLSL